MNVDVIVEVPKGGRNKYEIDHATGRVRLDRTLFTFTTRVTTVTPSTPWVRMAIRWTHSSWWTSPRSPAV